MLVQTIGTVSNTFDVIPEEISTTLVRHDLAPCQDRFFADLIFQGVRGSGHGLVVRPKGYIVESRFSKGRKANRWLRRGVQDYSVNDQRPCMSTDEGRARDWAEIR